MRRKILIVDATPRSKYVEDLILAGYDVECVSSGAQAIRSVMGNRAEYSALVVSPQIDDMKPFALVKQFMLAGQHTVRAIIPIILAEKHGAHVSQSWFVITPDNELLVRNALQELLGVWPRKKEDEEKPRGFFERYFSGLQFSDMWGQLGISW